jgi:hypothetical protein
MIRYQLVCDSGHLFESWFASSETYDKQAGVNMLSCPFCHSLKVSKALMTPQVARKDKDEAASVSLIDPEALAMREALAKVRAHLKDHGDNVGTRFADEARKIHSGETDARTIYGQTTGEEAQELLDEGVPFLSLPNFTENTQ